MACMKSEHRRGYRGVSQCVCGAVRISLVTLAPSVRSAREFLDVLCFPLPSLASCALPQHNRGHAGIRHFTDPGGIYRRYTACLIDHLQDDTNIAAVFRSVNAQLWKNQERENRPQPRQQSRYVDSMRGDRAANLRIRDGQSWTTRQSCCMSSFWSSSTRSSFILCLEHNDRHGH